MKDAFGKSGSILQMGEGVTAMEDNIRTGIGTRKWNIIKMALLVLLFSGCSPASDAQVGVSSNGISASQSSSHWDGPSAVQRQEQFLSSASMDPDLPLFSCEFRLNGGGSDEIWCEDISQVLFASPWTTETTFSTLPVFRNPLDYFDDSITINPDVKAMKEYLLEIAQRLGIEEEALSIQEEKSEHGFGLGVRRLLTDRVTASIPYGTVEVWTDMTAQIHFEPAIPIPQELNTDYYAPLQQVSELAEYMLQHHSGYFGMETPTIGIYGGRVNTYMQKSYGFYIYESGDDPLEQLLGYSFDLGRFSFTADGGISRVFLSKMDDLPKLGDYPALTVEQAKEALLQGQYSDGPSTPPKEENIHQVQLVYRTAASPYYVPCYVFYVLIEKEQRRWDLVPDEAQEYVPYYVPAVDHRYILDLPTR